MTGTEMLDDLVLPFQIDAFGLRGRVVRLGAAYRDAVDGHDYPGPVSRLMGESLALSATLAAALKYEGTFSLQIQGDGPMSMVVVQMNSGGDMRGYGRFDAGRVAVLEPPESVPRLLGAGHMAFTIEQKGLKDRYQGITDLAGATLAECAHGYFKSSEQIETAIKLACEPDRGAAGIMVQRLPDTEAEMEAEEAEENWRRAVVLLGSLTSEEMLDPGLPPRDLLYRLYHEVGVRVYKTRPLRHKCSCSEQKVRQTLSSFPREEVESMKVDGLVVVTCEFCKADYSFGDQDLEALFEAG